MELKLLGDTWNRPGNDFFTFRNNKNGAQSDFIKLISTSNGALVFNGVTTGVLPTDSFTTVEVMFHYDEATSLYNYVELYVNGVKIGGVALSDANLRSIDHFRMFTTEVLGQGVALNSLSLVKGCESLYVPSEKTEYVGYQTTAIANNKFDLRLIGVTADADVSAYKKVGFDVEVKIGDKTLTKTQDIGVVFDKIVATETTDGYKEYTAAELDGSHIFALTCKNIPTDQGAITFKVTTYYQIGEYAIVAGETVTFTVDPADIPNAEVK